MRVVVITATAGRDTINKTIESVAQQTVPTEHLIVEDGKLDDLHIFEATNHNRSIKKITLPENVGGGGWYGHRIYAAMPLLVNADYILFLDDDNWFEPNHVETMIAKIKSKDLMWSYSLRKIVDERGQYVCDDDCEALGRYPTFYDHTINFVDTNCYCFRREYLVSVAHNFYGQWGADRQFYQAVSKQLPAFGCTGETTVNYRARDDLLNMFKEGNEAMKKAYINLPWRNK